MSPIPKEESPRRARQQPYTIILAPGSGQKTWSINLSPERIRHLLIGGAVAGGFLLVIVTLSIYVLFQLGELQRLKSVNQEQAKQIQELKDFSVTVQDKLTRVKELDRQIRRMVGIDGGPDGIAEEEGEAPSQIPEQSSAVNEPGKKELQAFRSIPSRSGSNTQQRTSMSAAVRQLFSAEQDQLRLLSVTIRQMDSELEGQEKQLQQLNKEVTDRLAYLASVPSTYPVRGTVSSPFGNRRSPFGTKTEFHSGLDLAASYGTPVRAAAKGAVVFTGWKPGLGRVVEINHGHGFQTAYCHLSAITVKVNQELERGDMLGNVGNSGRSTGPHLHFMVYHQGKLQDPERYLLH
ncbi:peptidoglycan DD-metalloendopeptidase family protein [Heliobacterium undosum]|uniref:Peptidoglycan DD-metalloendopeptidase family protein n=1 Tax=Heliomicrobium undosum TaxID=121734 RepID=A0A845L1Z5_9FIRM|nr:M23 family metallopeptidase [Heliomicrobium undosum]MZP29656.1 peptidoglycan DD-metalloendopeptidase family protein [Heliomicrobium undosum]